MIDTTDDGGAGKREGMGRGLRHANPDFVAEAHFLLDRMQVGNTFTVCKLRDMMSEGTHDDRALGGIIRGASQKGTRFVKMGYETSGKARNHHRPFMRWRKVTR